MPGAVLLSAERKGSFRKLVDEHIDHRRVGKTIILVVYSQGDGIVSGLGKSMARVRIKSQWTAVAKVPGVLIGADAFV